MAKRSRRGDRDRRQALNAGRPRLGIAGIAGLLAVAGTALFVAGRPRPAAALRLPSTPNQNVLLVTIYTILGDALGCYGGTARTPNIDGLAAAGIRFTFAHAHSVVTLPSHASILTGTYPFQHGFRENSGYRLTPGLPTLATLLKAQGFATAAFVGAFPLDARFGLTPGFDVYDGRFDDLTGGGFIIAERPATAVVAPARAWIREQRGRWFAWVHVYEPHAPYRPPPPFDREYAARPYFGEVAAADRALGPLFDAVRLSVRPTLVVLTGDHGEALGDHGESTHGLFAYETTLRIPLIIAQIAGEAHTDGAEVSDAPVRHVDILPTILDAVQVAAPPDLPGHSLRRRADRDHAAGRASYFEAMSPMLDYGWAPLSGVLAGREKYIELPLPELYDLSADSGELNNLVPRAGERQRAMAARLGAFHAPLPRAPAAETADVARRLQALGYVSGGAAAKAHYTEADDPKHLVDIDQKMHDAVALDEDGRTQEAIALYREILSRRRDMMAAARHLAFDYWRVGSMADAIATLRIAMAAGSTAGAQIQLGTYLVEAGNASEALAMLEQAAKTEPTLDALNALGIAYARNGRAREALDVFARSLNIDPDNPMTHENIGAIHLIAGRLDAARAEFEHALRANPASAQGHAGLAMVAFKSGDRATAIDRWKRAVELDPTNWDALYDLGVQLARAGRAAEARPYLERFAASAPPAQYARDIQEISAELAKGR